MAGFAAVALTALGCADPRPATQVLVDVIMEDGVRAETSSLVITVRGAVAGEELVETYTTTYSAADEGGIPDPVALVIAPALGDVNRAYEAQAEALDRVGGTVGMARLRGVFQPGRTLELRLVLEDRCRGVLCPDDQTCRQGRCVPSEVVPDMDGGTVDAGAPDGSVIPPGGDCRRDLGCDDGIFCNGVERCIGGTCAPGVRESCDDGVACTTDSCVSTGCVNVPDASTCTAGPDPMCDPVNGCQYSICDATTCVSDGCIEATCSGTNCRRTQLCLAGEMCCAGACVPAGCDDESTCTTDLCDPTRGCVYTESGASACSDGNACTTGDQCRGETCRATGDLSCDDTNRCTADRCDPLLGCAADALPTGTPCLDTDLCNGAEACVSGTCAAGPPLDCDDRVACTTDACSPTAGCTHVPNDAACTVLPGGTCNPSTGCQYPTCTPATCVAGPCQTATCVGATCNVVDLCTAGEICCAGSCAPAGCADPNPCTMDACGASGCTHVPQPGLACEDGSACTVGDTCNASGTCASGPGCNDNNPCTDDVCSGGACSYPNNTAACDDMDGCTGGDACSGGSCRPGPLMLCDDDNPCTADSCSVGVCQHEALTGISCGEIDTCVTRRCEAGICRIRINPHCNPD